MTNRNVGTSRVIPRIPRLPQAPSARGEGLAFLAMGVATVAMVGLLQTGMIRLVPRAGTFAQRLRETPGMLVSPGYVLRYLGTNDAAQSAMNSPGRNGVPTKASACGSPAPAS